ncbi:MAG: hypothetical protein WDN28_29855 [Chthoniobacter sp.]
MLILNSDKDPIFPLDGVMNVYNRTATLYRTLGHAENIGIHIAEGPHLDTQQLNFGAFNWIDRFLQGAKREDLIDEPARPAFKPRELKVFTEIPKDEKVTSIDQSFRPRLPPEDRAAHRCGMAATARWLDASAPPRLLPRLARRCHASTPHPPAASTAEGLRLTKVDFQSEADIPLTLWLLHRADVKPEDLELVVLNALDDEGWQEFRTPGRHRFWWTVSWGRTRCRGLCRRAQDARRHQVGDGLLLPRAAPGPQAGRHSRR